MLDLDELARQEHENWVWHGAQALRPEYQLALVSLSRGGADAAIVREFDLEKKSFIKDGYTLPEAKSRVAWRDADSLFVGTDFGPGSLTDSGYPRIVKEWKRGTPLTEAAVVFEGRAEDMGVDAHRDLTPGFERDIVIRTPTFFTSETFLRRDGKLVKIDKPDDAQASLPPRVAAPPAPHRLDRRRQDLSGRRAAGDRPRGVPQGGSRLRRAVRADRAEVAGEPSARRGISSCSTSWTTSGAGSRS